MYDFSYDESPDNYNSNQNASHHHPQPPQNHHLSTVNKFHQKSLSLTQFHINPVNCARLLTKCRRTGPIPTKVVKNPRKHLQHHIEVNNLIVSSKYTVVVLSLFEDASDFEAGPRVPYKTASFFTRRDHQPAAANNQVPRLMNDQHPRAISFSLLTRKRRLASR